MRNSPKVNQAAVERAFKGAKNSGISFAKISLDVTTGVIEFFPGQAADVAATSDYDEWAKKQNAR